MRNIEHNITLLYIHSSDKPFPSATAIAYRYDLSSRRDVVLEACVGEARAVSPSEEIWKPAALIFPTVYRKRGSFYTTSRRVKHRYKRAKFKQKEKIESP